MVVVVAVVAMVAVVSSFGNGNVTKWSLIIRNEKPPRTSTVVVVAVDIAFGIEVEGEQAPPCAELHHARTA